MSFAFCTLSQPFYNSGFFFHPIVYLACFCLLFSVSFCHISSLYQPPKIHNTPLETSLTQHLIKLASFMSSFNDNIYHVPLQGTVCLWFPLGTLFPVRLVYLTQIICCLSLASQYALIRFCSGRIPHFFLTLFRKPCLFHLCSLVPLLSFQSTFSVSLLFRLFKFTVQILLQEISNKVLTDLFQWGFSFYCHVFSVFPCIYLLPLICLLSCFRFFCLRLYHEEIHSNFHKNFKCT